MLAKVAEYRLGMKAGRWMTIEVRGSASESMEDTQSPTSFLACSILPPKNWGTWHRGKIQRASKLSAVVAIWWCFHPVSVAGTLDNCTPNSLPLGTFRCCRWFLALSTALYTYQCLHQQ